MKVAELEGPNAARIMERFGLLEEIMAKANECTYGEFVEEVGG